MEKVLNSNSLEEGTVKRSIILLYQQMIKKLPEYFSEQEINERTKYVRKFHNKYGRKTTSSCSLCN